MSTEKYIDAEDLEDGGTCHTDGCGGVLRDDPFGEGLFCEVCQTRFKGR